MHNKLHTQTKDTQKLSSVFHNTPVQGMFESLSLVAQQKQQDNSQPANLKTSLMQAKRYGHKISKIKPKEVSIATPHVQQAQPEQRTLEASPIQRAFHHDDPQQITPFNQLLASNRLRSPNATSWYDQLERNPRRIRVDSNVPQGMGGGGYESNGAEGRVLHFNPTTPSVLYHDSTDINHGQVTDPNPKIGTSIAKGYLGRATTLHHELGHARQEMLMNLPAPYLGANGRQLQNQAAGHANRLYEMHNIIHHEKPFARNNNQIERTTYPSAATAQNVLPQQGMEVTTRTGRSNQVNVLNSNQKQGRLQVYKKTLDHRDELALRSAIMSHQIAARRQLTTPRNPNAPNTDWPVHSTMLQLGEEMGKRRGKPIDRTDAHLFKNAMHEYKNYRINQNFDASNHQQNGHYTLPGKELLEENRT